MSDRFALVVSRAIRAERARAGMTQSELAEKIGLTRGWVAMIESAARPLPVHVLPELCRSLGITLSLLFERADPEDREAMGL